jgi:tetratricopeptide (TPR) repeat protein
MFKFLEKIERTKYWQLFFITVAVHILMLKNNFTYYSDDAYVLLNPIVTHFSVENLKLMFLSYFDGHYHPLTLLTLSINYAMSGNHAISYNITNLLIHSSNVVLIFVFIKLLFKRSDFAFVVALIWAVHPLHVESVARITDRKDTQYVFFLLIALINYLKYKSTLHQKFLIYTLVAFLLSLLSKGQALIFPFIIFLIEFYNYKADNKKIDFKTISYFLPISLFFAWLAIRAQLFTGYLSQTEDISVSQIIFYPSSILSNYIVKLFIPLNLSAQYSIPNISEISSHYYLLIIPIILMVALFFSLIKKQYIYFFGIVFYLVTVSIMLRVIPIAENFMPDRYNYLPSLGFCIIIAQFYFYLNQKIKSTQVIKYIGYSYILFFAAISFLRVPVWKDGLSVWLDAYKKYPKDTDILQNLGGIYLTKQQPNIAVGYLQKSVESDSLNILARLSLYKTYKALSENDKAKKELVHLFNLKPKTANQFSNQAVVFSQFGMYDKAIELNSISMQKHPLFIKFQVNDIGFLLYKMEFEKALQKTEDLLSINPYCANMLYEMKAKTNIGLFNAIDALSNIELAEKTGTKKEVVKEFTDRANLVSEKYVSYSSTDFNLLIQSGKELFNQKAYVNALKFFEKCDQISPNNESVLNNICACYFNLSRPDKVQEYYSKIIKNNFQKNPNLETYLSTNIITY